MQFYSDLDITPELKALSIHGPWAWAILAGHKRVENRSWNTSYRGRLAIHAGRSRDSDERATALFRSLGIDYPDEFPRGAILGTVDLLDVLPREAYLEKFGADPVNRSMAFGPLCWVLDNPRIRKPIPCAGALSLWNVQDILKKSQS